MINGLLFLNKPQKVFLKAKNRKLVQKQNKFKQWFVNILIKTKTH